MGYSTVVCRPPILCCCVGSMSKAPIPSSTISSTAEAFGGGRTMSGTLSAKAPSACLPAKCSNPASLRWQVHVRGPVPSTHPHNSHVSPLRISSTISSLAYRRNAAILRACAGKSTFEVLCHQLTLTIVTCHLSNFSLRAFTLGPEIYTR